MPSRGFLAAATQGPDTFPPRSFGKQLDANSDRTMTALEEKLVEYIDDAYAMEQNVLRMLDGMIRQRLRRPAASWRRC
jgi:hypothetical protein